LITMALVYNGEAMKITTNYRLDQESLRILWQIRPPWLALYMGRI
jgi:hypothetical protein